MKMIGLIWAQSENGVIGHGGKIPWNVPEDLKRFKEITITHPVIMGRKTWDSLPGGALPGRTNIVISRFMEAVGDKNIVVARSFAAALEAAEQAAGNDRIWVIGGAEVFRAAADIAEIACVTYIKGVYQGDVEAPGLDDAWVLKSQEPEIGSWLRSVQDGDYRFATYRNTQVSTTEPIPLPAP